MKKEGDGRVWGRAQGFRKVLDKSPGVQKGAKKGPPKILKNLES